MELEEQAAEEGLTKMCMGEKKNYMEIYNQKMLKKIRIARKTLLLIDNGHPGSCGYF